MKTRILSAAVAATMTTTMVMAIGLSASPARAIPVFDASNYAQNILTAARTLTMINNQITSLTNEATMLLDMGKHLKTISFPELTRLQDTLARIDSLIGKAKGIQFKVAGLDADFAAMFPDASKLSYADRIAKAHDRLDSAMDGFRQAMSVQAQVVENVANDTKLLAELAKKNDAAEGSLQAQQATNQLLALAAKQSFQIQQLMAADYRAEAVERARRLQEQEDARAATRKFLGSGHAYTPE